ncbi:MAG: type II toxin-antitoxin system RelE/ParE family toxin [Hymenobacter sp.]|nr:MAG: type II toxin-antitoxin system RelE/ParE family toxin [Hymenobacter sp.]
MTIKWSPTATAELTKQAAWLEEHRGHSAVIRYFEQVNSAIERLRRGGLVLYRLYDATRDIRYCHLNKHTQLYYQVVEADGYVELLTFFDMRQDPDKLNL